ncbi:MAG: transposase [Clostridia bacterium]|nr:transposase [Clostridia bacterium]
MKERGNQVVLPLNVAKMIDESDPVFKTAEILSKLDYRELRRTYRRHWRSVDPEIMFSIVVYANMKGIFSSRGIEEACKTDKLNGSVRKRYEVFTYGFRCGVKQLSRCAGLIVGHLETVLIEVIAQIIDERGNEPQIVAVGVNRIDDVDNVDGLSAVIIDPEVQLAEFFNIVGSIAVSDKSLDDRLLQKIGRRYSSDADLVIRIGDVMLCLVIDIVYNDCVLIYRKEELIEGRPCDGLLLQYHPVGKSLILLPESPARLAVNLDVPHPPAGNAEEERFRNALLLFYLVVYHEKGQISVRVPASVKMGVNRVKICGVSRADVVIGLDDPEHSLVVFLISC